LERANRKYDLSDNPHASHSLAVWTADWFTNQKQEQ